jgi:hypothetical protein
MLEKAKNRKIFYFFIFIVLGVSLIIPPLSATTYSMSSGVGIGYEGLPVSWSTIRGYSTGTVYSNSGDYISIVKAVAFSSWDNPNTFTKLWRVIIAINTSSMSDGYNQINPVLWLKQGSTDSTQFSGDRTIHIVKVDPTPVGSTADYNNFDFSQSYGYFTIGSLSNSFLAVNISEDFPFNTEGITYFGLVLGDDMNNTMPSPWGATANAQVAFDRSPAPYLTVDSEEPAQDCNIEASPENGPSPLAVSFTDKSEGFTEGVDLAYLDYGDGNSYSGTYPGNGATRNYIYLDAGTYNYSYRLTHSGTNYYSNGTVTVTGDSTVNFQVIVRGLNGAYIGNATVNIWYDSGTMIDSDITDDFYGSADFYVNPSRYVNGNVTKDGYYTSNFTYYVCPTGYCNNEVWITLYTLNETPGSGDEFGNYLVTFKNIVTGESVGYSNIEVYSDSGYTTLYYDEYSNAGGVWTGLVPMNIDLYYKYPETTGYYSQSWSYNLTSSPAYKTVNLVPKSGTTSTVTPTPTVTVTTITPTVTYTYNAGELDTLNVKERFTNLLVLAGFQNAKSADLIFAMIIVLGCTALIGWITLSGSGAGMGAIIGFVFSLGLGLIPLWLLIAAIFFACLYVALKLFGGSGE